MAKEVLVSRLRSPFFTCGSCSQYVFFLSLSGGFSAFPHLSHNKLGLCSSQILYWPCQWNQSILGTWPLVSLRCSVLLHWSWALHWSSLLFFCHLTYLTSEGKLYCNNMISLLACVGQADNGALYGEDGRQGDVSGEVIMPLVPKLYLLSICPDSSDNFPIRCLREDLL